MQNQLLGLAGLVALAAGTVIEAGLAAKKAHEEERGNEWKSLTAERKLHRKGVGEMQRPCFNLKAFQKLRGNLTMEFDNHCPPLRSSA